MKHLAEKLTIAQDTEFQVGTSRGVFAIQQTQRNLLKKELMDGMRADLEEFAQKYGFEFYMTNDGPILVIANESVEDELYSKDKNGDYSGKISIEFDIKIKNLDFDAEVEGEIYEVERAEALAKAEAAKKTKEKKIAEDAAKRAEKARLKEALIAEKLGTRE